MRPGETVTSEPQSTGASLSIHAPPWCSPSPLADLSWITVTSQWGTGHLQQSQHLIKPSLPKSSPTQSCNGTVPIRKATDRFLILFPFPPSDWEYLVRQLSSKQLQGGSRNPQALCRTSVGWAMMTDPESQRQGSVPALCNPWLWSYSELWLLTYVSMFSSLPIHWIGFPSLCSSCGQFLA